MVYAMETTQQQRERERTNFSHLYTMNVCYTQGERQKKETTTAVNICQLTTVLPKKETFFHLFYRHDFSSRFERWIETKFFSG